MNAFNSTMRVAPLVLGGYAYYEINRHVNFIIQNDIDNLQEGYDSMKKDTNKFKKETIYALRAMIEMKHASLTWPLPLKISQYKSPIEIACLIDKV